MHGHQEQPLSMPPAHAQHHIPVLLLLEAGEPQPHGLQRYFYSALVILGCESHSARTAGCVSTRAIVFLQCLPKSTSFHEIIGINRCGSTHALRSADQKLRTYFLLVLISVNLQKGRNRAFS